ncbi:triosephosphate isomerase [Phyllobacterium sp. 1468]|uniref:triose-phosphate isomerase n=1 Tax=Phyllobacterium sp. 1468 TaxID=2817759 RepID=UPI00285CEF7F|nr:triose-phosphate isomerase [Phyllobacterium sp. 1468]MDR6635990.1 triosephosphate isomerase [Phyllobacterium sp. 1468]
MTPDVRPLVAGNWKMNGTGESLEELRIIVNRPNSAIGEKIDALICVPATLVFRAAQSVEGEALSIGGEDCHTKKSGAYTGCISADMLKDAGASHVIVGHSERRADNGETDEMINAKARAAWDAGLVAIICIGETEAQRQAGATLGVVATQLSGSVPDGANADNSIIAYEPVWAIGTGLTPTAKDVQEVHTFIRSALSTRFGGEGAKMRILYGGSVKPANAVELLGVENVDGALVGGASLKAADFLAICEAYHSL